MAKVTGKNAVVDFGSTVYACASTMSVDGTANVISGECSTDGTGNATTHKAVGAENWTVSVTLMLEGSASTVPSALDVGTSGALLAYPEGNESGQLEYDWTTAYVSTHTVSSSTSSFMMLDVTFECDGAPTIGTAA